MVGKEEKCFSVFMLVQCNFESKWEKPLCLFSTETQAPVKNLWAEDKDENVRSVMDTDLNDAGLFSMVCLQQSAANTECAEGSRSGASTAGHKNSKGGRSADEVRGRHLGVGTAQDCHCRDRK